MDPLEINKQLQEAIERSSIPLEQLGQFSQMWMQALESLSPTINQAEEALKDFFEKTTLIQQVLEQSATQRKVMLASGWWYAPSLMDLPSTVLFDAIDEYESGNMLAITNLFKRVYQADKCSFLEATTLNWLSNKFFAPWKDHLIDALEAHRAGKYNLSVPVLLLVTEGIATDFCKENGIKTSRSNIKGEKITKALKSQHRRNNQVVFLELDLIDSAINETIYADTEILSARLATNILNRHAVLHGLKRDYGTEESSLRSFMLLDVLSALT